MPCAKGLVASAELESVLGGGHAQVPSYRVEYQTLVTKGTGSGSRLSGCVRGGALAGEEEEDQEFIGT